MLPAAGLNLKSCESIKLKRDVEATLASGKTLQFFVFEIEETGNRVRYSVTTDQIELFFSKETTDKSKCLNCEHIFVKEKKLRYFEHLRSELISVGMSVTSSSEKTATAFSSSNADELKERLKTIFACAYRVIGKDDPTIRPSGGRKFQQSGTDWIPLLPSSGSLMQVFLKHRKDSIEDGFFKVQFTEQLKRRFVWTDSTLKNVTISRTTDQQIRRLQENALNAGEEDGDQLFIVDYQKKRRKQRITVII